MHAISASLNHVCVSVGCLCVAHAHRVWLSATGGEPHQHVVERYLQTGQCYLAL